MCLCILDNKSLTIRAILLNGATASATVWTKDYTVKTDDYGLFSIVLGDGAGESAFASINWGNGKYFLNVQILIGKNWTDLSTTQLLSVPYALYAKSSGTVTNSETDPVYKAAPAAGIKSADISNWNAAFGWGNHSGLYRPLSYVPAWSEITSNPFSISSLVGISCPF